MNRDATDNASPVPTQRERDTLQMLLDIEAIKKLKARYLRLLDQKRWSEWADLFTEDVWFKVNNPAPSGAPPEPICGRDELVGRISKRHLTTHTAHHCHMPEIEVTSPTTARGTWAMQDIVDGLAPEMGWIGWVGYGYYEEEYRKENGEWRIARLELFRLRFDGSLRGTGRAAEGNDEVT